jgi:hypothetical protein
MIPVFELAPEMHDNGPLRYAGKVADTILEIYPFTGEADADATTRLPRGTAWKNWTNREGACPRFISPGTGRLSVRVWFAGLSCPRSGASENV